MKEQLESQGYDNVEVIPNCKELDILDAKTIKYTEGIPYRLCTFSRVIKEKGIAIPKIHIQSSYGFLNYPELKCNYVRTGVALYGVLSSPNDCPGFETPCK